MAPRTKLTNEQIQESAESFNGSFVGFRIVHELRKKDLIGKGEDDAAMSKIRTWLNVQITVGTYEVVGKFGNANKYVRITSEYLQKKETDHRAKVDAETAFNAFEKVLLKTLGAELYARRPNSGQVTINLNVEQVKRLTTILDFVDVATPVTGKYKSDCGSCLGYGHFDEEGKPTIDKRCRKCLDCNGTGEHQE